MGGQRNDPFGRNDRNDPFGRGNRNDPMRTNPRMSREQQAQKQKQQQKKKQPKRPECISEIAGTAFPKRKPEHVCEQNKKGKWEWRKLKKEEKEKLAAESGR